MPSYKSCNSCNQNLKMMQFFSSSLNALICDQCIIHQIHGFNFVIKFLTLQKIDLVNKTHINQIFKLIYQKIILSELFNFLIAFMNSNINHMLKVNSIKEVTKFPRMKETNISEKFDTNNYHFNPDSKFGTGYLIHGFSSSTYEVKKLAKHLSQKGYQVRADNLPGHGTTIEDCNSTKYYEWLNAVEKGVAEMYSACDKVIVIGVSMGGVLSLHLGSLFPLDGIISASALFKFKNEFNVRFINRIFNKLKKTVPKKSTFNPDQVKAQNIQFYGYKHYPLCT